MAYPKTEGAKPIYFLLLKLFRTSDKKVISRNFYWLHTPGSDYKLLEDYRQRKVPLRITSQVIITGTTYNIQMQMENKSKDSKNLINEIEAPTKYESIFKGSSSSVNKGKKVVETGGNDKGVAFFLHLSVHNSEKAKRSEGEDTRILPVHYSDNYFSLVPGEKTTVSLSFEVPKGISPRVTLDGWNYHENYLLL